MAIDWEAVETAIQNWVEAGSGYPDANVLWAQQSPPRKDQPFVLLEVRSLRVVGQDWVTVRDAPDAEGEEEPTPGAEIEHVVGGTRELVLAVSVFGGEAIGPLSSAGVLSRILTAASLPAIREALNAAGVGIGGFGHVTTMVEIADSLVEPRAVCDVRLHLAEELVGTDTFIERVEIENLTTGESTEVPPP